MNTAQQAQHPVLNKGQELALNTVLGGHSCFISGPGGTGKSFLIRHLYVEVQARGHNIGVTALTGCAALLLSHVKAKTLHSWAGIGLGKESAKILATNIKKYGGKALKNWVMTDVLIIDEVSMMDPELLDKLNEIGKIIRRSELPFGGIQMVFVGDFYQLPPVRKQPAENEPPLPPEEFSFESKAWAEVNPKVVLLTEIVRQADPVFQEILGEARRGGTLSDKAISILQSRQTDEWQSKSIKPTLLFSRRQEVDMINQKNLNALPRETRVIYKAHTTFSARLESGLDKNSEKVKRAVHKLDMNAQYQSELELRTGAQVMLVSNLDIDQELVNGSRGVVIGFCDTEPRLPLVQFNNGKAPMKVGEHSWESEDVEGVFRVQIPLICAWAITIHKSQGSTLDSALIDIGESTFERGQAYVALSRVKSLEALYVWDLDPQAFKTHPKVTAYYASITPVTADGFGRIVQSTLQKRPPLDMSTVPKTKKGAPCQACVLRLQTGNLACPQHRKTSSSSQALEFVEE